MMMQHPMPSQFVMSTQNAFHFAQLSLHFSVFIFNSTSIRLRDNEPWVCRRFPASFKADEGGALALATELVTSNSFNFAVVGAVAFLELYTLCLPLYNALRFLRCPQWWRILLARIAFHFPRAPTELRTKTMSMQSLVASAPRR